MNRTTNTFRFINTNIQGQGEGRIECVMFRVRDRLGIGIGSVCGVPARLLQLAIASLIASFPGSFLYSMQHVHKAAEKPGNVAT